MFFFMIILWTGGLLYGAYQLGPRLLGVNLFTLEQVSKAVYLIPVWLVGLLILRALFKKKKSQKIIQQAVADHPFVPVKGFVPNAMPSQGKSMSFVPQITNNPAQNTMPSTFSAPSQAPSMPTNGEAEAVQEITRIAEEKGLTPFPHVLLKNVMISLTVSSDVKAMLFKFLSTPGTWQVDETENLSDSLWTNQGKSFLQAKELLQAKAILQEMEPSAEVIPVFVLLEGGLVDEEKAQAYLNKFKAHIVCLKRKENSHLKTVSELFDEVFKEPIPPMPTLKGEENAQTKTE